MDLSLHVSVAIVAAVILGELTSIVWYSKNMPWGRAGERYWLSALASDVGLAFLLQFISRNYWVVHGYPQAAWLALWLSVLFFCLEAPHEVYNHRSLTRFFWHSTHKFAIMFVMTLALYHFKNY